MVPATGVEPAKAPGLSRLAVPIYLSHAGFKHRQKKEDSNPMGLISPQHAFQTAPAPGKIIFQIFRAFGQAQSKSLDHTCHFQAGQTVLQADLS